MPTIENNTINLRKGKKLPRNIKSFSTIEKVVTNFRDKEGQGEGFYNFEKYQIKL